MSAPRTGPPPSAPFSIRRAGGPGRVRHALQRVRQANSADGALELGLLEVCVALGFRRAAFSRLHGDRLVAELVHVPNAPRVAARMLDQLAALRVRLADLPDEAAAAASGDAVLVATPQRSRVPPELAAIVGRQGYVAAPLTRDGVIIGFVHADDHDSAYPLSAHDRDCLWAFTEALSCVVAWRRTLEECESAGRPLGQHVPSR